MIEFALPPEHLELRERVTAFVRDDVIPHENDPRQDAHGPSDALRLELVDRARAAGLLSPHAPVAWGGLGLDHRGMFGAVAVAVSFFLRRTRLGTYVYAIGDNPFGARVTGIPTRPVIVLQYVLAALIGMFAGMVMSLGHSGRLIAIDLAGGAASVIASGLAYAFGASAAGTETWVSESWSSRVQAFAGGRRSRAVTDSLPGYPSRISAAQGGGFWLTCFALRTQLIEFVLREHAYRRRMVKRFDEATYQRRVVPIIERWFSQRTKAELEAMAGNRIALTPIKKIDEVVADPHLREREMFVPVRVGAATVEVFGSPIKLSGSPVRCRGETPSLGQHNHEVYVDWLGIPVERFAALKAQGVI